MLEDSDPGGQYVYAGFWWRVWAALLDWIASTIILGIIGFVIGFSLAASDVIGRGDGDAIGRVVGLGGSILYFTLFESSSLRGTPGKLICGLQVVDESGNQISFGRALGRYLGKFVSALILGIGFMMAGWTRRKQALHDMMSGCLVLRRRSASIPIRLPT